MKRFVYAAAAIVLTGALVLLAMAVAQRDARLSDGSADANELAYANQPALPITGTIGDGFGTTYSSGNDWPPAPIIRGNDSALPNGFPSSNFPEIRPTSNASLTSYAGEGGLPTRTDESPIIRKSTSTGTFAEPPPLSALNTFLTPSSNGSSDPSNPSMSLPNTLPTNLSSLPISSSIAQEPSPNLSELPPSNSTTFPYSPPNTLGSPNTLPSERTNPAFATPPPPVSNTIDGTPPPRLQSYPPPSTTTQPFPVATFGTPKLPGPLQNSPSPKSISDAAQTNDTSSGFVANPPSSTKSTGFSSAAPGVRHLDGSQNPSLEIQKRAPNEVQVGIPSTFTLLVRNVGNATAFDVHVIDSVPKGAKLIRTSPQAQPNGPNGLSWNLGEIAAGAEQTITIELVPELEGEIGSVASVNFAAQASVRTMSTQPKLVVKQLLEPLVLGGESVKIMIDVSNAGTGIARNVRLEEDVPQNMRHASGAKVLELSVGDLAPGESQKFDIELTAISAGKVSNILRAVAENAVVNESASPIEVVAPKLQIGVEGPKMRYLERQATYAASITNTGTAIATDIYLTCHLPSGLQFNSAENLGEYIPNQHAVMWRLAELAAGKTVITKFTLMPVEEGDFVLRIQADAHSIRAEAVEKPVRVEGQSELAFSIEDDNDPIETDGKTTYVIKIVNTGTRVDNDVQLQIDLPDGAIVEQVDAPVSYQTSQKAVQFAPIPQMKSKDQTTIRIAVRHTREGTHVLRAQLKSNLRPGAVIKEESTQVYRDQ